ncbi:hypothetical protein EIP91_006969 [Steccherinum ochraceum]|uniref:Uncharacterized protein n=1 Tax=Steccherinum ochraceum TaxID=92696 RepID=A0A4R0R4S2_9APHY|nr:hypothetical protein EIP91_006969 [Steccherinum ochraceum]
MKARLSIAASTVWFSLVAMANVALFCGTMYRKLAPDKELTYSWIDNDTPLEVPTDIPTVEMTFQESARFTLSDESNKPNWLTLFKNRYGIGFTHLGPFHHRFIPASYHSLHCVYNIQLDFDKPNHATETSLHFIHCLWYLREVFLCNADVSLEDGDFMTKNYTLERMGETRQCKDWTVAADFVSRNFLDWAAYNGVYYNTTDL